MSEPFDKEKFLMSDDSLPSRVSTPQAVKQLVDYVKATILDDLIDPVLSINIDIGSAQFVIDNGYGRYSYPLSSLKDLVLTPVDEEPEQ